MEVARFKTCFSTLGFITSVYKLEKLHSASVDNQIDQIDQYPTAAGNCCSYLLSFILKQDFHGDRSLKKNWMEWLWCWNEFEEMFNVRKVIN